MLDLGPFQPMPRLLQAPVQLLAQHQGQKTAKHMPPDRLIALMNARTGLEQRLDLPEDLFDPPELLVFERHLGSGQRAVGPQHPFAVKTGLGLNFAPVDREASLAQLEVFAVAPIAQEALRGLLEACLKALGMACRAKASLRACRLLEQTI